MWLILSNKKACCILEQKYAPGYSRLSFCVLFVLSLLDLLGSNGFAGDSAGIEDAHRVSDFL